MRGRTSTRLQRLASQQWTPLPFLCPSLLAPPAISIRRAPANTTYSRRPQRRCIHIETARDAFRNKDLTASLTSSKLPLNCPGCGAYSQTDDIVQPGYYATARRPVKAFVASHSSQAQEVEEKVYESATATLTKDRREALGLVNSKEPAKDPTPNNQAVPLCDRCHELLHHNRGVPIFHPNMSSLQDIISETPHKNNHIYHVLDAADFPMSLIPRIQEHLDLTPQRSKNRRSQPHKYRGGRSAELSFIITRSDLLASRKVQVDRLMPVLTDILRDALGRNAQDVRLGNVRCVSSKRGWWTKEVKDDIWKRGGGQWMVGKVNVGKSNLFENVFPKGRMIVDIKQAVRAARGTNQGLGPNQTDARVVPRQGQTAPDEEHPKRLVEDVDDSANPVGAEAGTDGTVVSSQEQLKSLVLPPAAPEVAFPPLPTVSHLPGTTAQPIRLRFGAGRGELIDLPGLDRRDLTNYVREDQQQNLVMRSRETPLQVSIKPGQSLMIGDLIRITPVSSHVFLAAAFVPLDTHVTNTAKAAAVQQQEATSPAITKLLKPGMGEKIKSAGWFELKWVVTKQRAGPLTRPDAAGLKPSVLPFVIYSADILIEGVGWVEMAVQVRRRQIEQDPNPPMVEVFSPMGKHIATRRPLGAFMLAGGARKPVSQRSQRPRKSMKGVKKAEKRATRETVAP